MYDKIVNVIKCGISSEFDIRWTVSVVYYFSSTTRYTMPGGDFSVNKNEMKQTFDWPLNFIKFAAPFAYFSPIARLVAKMSVGLRRNVLRLFILIDVEAIRNSDPSVMESRRAREAERMKRRKTKASDRLLNDTFVEAVSAASSTCRI